MLDYSQVVHAANDQHRIQVGKGRWKEILLEGQKQGLFTNRSQVDLKDKWRYVDG